LFGTIFHGCFLFLFGFNVLYINTLPKETAFFIGFL